MEKQYEIGFCDKFIYCDDEIEYEITNNGELMLSVEDCAFALGVTQTKKTKNGESVTVRWERVYDDLIKIERIPNLGDFRKLSNVSKKEIRKELKLMKIKEKELYLWSFIVDSENGKKFRNWLSEIVLPNLRKYGMYINGMENMNAEEIKIATNERLESYVLRKFGITIRKELTSIIKSVVNPKPEERYVYAKYTNIIYEVLFGMECKEYKETRGLIKKSDSLRDDMKEKGESKLLDLISKAEDFMGNLLISGITDYEMLYDMIKKWKERKDKI